MKRRITPLVLSLLLGAMLLVPFVVIIGIAVIRKASPSVAESVEITVHQRDGGSRATSTNMPEVVAEIGSYFPDYYRRPSGPPHGDWRPRYTVFFVFDDGSFVRITTDGTLWTCGKGDLEVQGNFVDRAEQFLIRPWPIPSN